VLRGPHGSAPLPPPWLGDIDLPIATFIVSKT